METEDRPKLAKNIYWPIQKLKNMPMAKSKSDHESCPKLINEN